MTEKYFLQPPQSKWSVADANLFSVDDLVFRTDNAGIHSCNSTRAFSNSDA